MTTGLLPKLAILGILLYPSAQATTSFQLEPVSGSVSGSPGLTVGWGFTLVNTEDYLVVTSANFDSPSDLGTFTDFISAPANFFVVGPALGGSTVWGQTFNAAAQTGVGGFTIKPGAVPGDIAAGEIVLTYDLFSVSPNNPNFNPDTDGISFGNRLSANALVETVVPEPEHYTAAFGVALLGTGVWLRRKKIHGVGVNRPNSPATAL